MFIFILILLFCISFLLALISLWRDLKRNIKTEHVTNELSKGRVLFQAPSTGNVTVENELEEEKPV